MKAIIFSLILISALGAAQASELTPFQAQKIAVEFAKNDSDSTHHYGGEESIEEAASLVTVREYDLLNMMISNVCEKGSEWPVCTLMVSMDEFDIHDYHLVNIRYVDCAMGNTIIGVNKNTKKAVYFFGILKG